MKETTARMRTIRAVLALLILAPLLFAADHPDILGAGIANGSATDRLLKIGTISTKDPTVSSLLTRNPGLKNNYWDIIHAEPNRNKDFTRIPPGTEVYYNPATKELLWADTTSNTVPVAVMPETAFEFPPTMEGESITHDFLIQNRGKKDLTVLEVKTT